MYYRITIYIYICSWIIPSSQIIAPWKVHFTFQF